jgi:hypothetical protein
VGVCVWGGLNFRSLHTDSLTDQQAADFHFTSTSSEPKPVVVLPHA